MRKILTLVALLSMVAPAFGQEFGHERGHRVGQHSGHAPLPPPRPYGRDGGNILPWVAGGLAIGALSGIYLYEQRRCYDELVGYDRRGREVWETYCN
jgi:hypothetical protein